MSQPISEHGGGARGASPASAVATRGGRITFILGGSLFIVSSLVGLALLPFLPFGEPLYRALGDAYFLAQAAATISAMVLFAAGLIVFAWGIRGEGSVVARRPLGAVAPCWSSRYGPLSCCCCSTSSRRPCGRSGPRRVRTRSRGRHLCRGRDRRDRHRCGASSARRMEVAAPVRVHLRGGVCRRIPFEPPVRAPSRRLCADLRHSRPLHPVRRDRDIVPARCRGDRIGACRRISARADGTIARRSGCRLSKLEHSNHPSEPGNGLRLRRPCPG